MDLWYEMHAQRVRKQKVFEREHLQRLESLRDSTRLQHVKHCFHCKYFIHEDGRSRWWQPEPNDPSPEEILKNRMVSQTLLYFEPLKVYC
ncbi:ORF11 [White sturgeon adenovirus 1]|uniref:ORF11 n=1 Tax=White sturgeon adenovirus 1 TaxID=2580388 RepID=A0A4P8PIR6_9ADEN|nr:ORF11 [White sturgeon adenovirus 1]QCQ84192.1 ORF11 [White sturgeon adenovirus 1]